MGNVIAVVNHKGGTGKTTTALNLAAGLTRYSDITSSCLVIDMDPHGCATSTLLGKLDGEPAARSIFDVLRRAITPHDGITSTVYDENIDIIPSNPSLESMARTQLTDRLIKVTQALSTSYGWIIIDTPPNLGVLTQNALVAADYVLIPTQCTGLAVPTMHQLKNLIERIQERQNVWLQILGVLVTMKDGRTELQKNVLKELKGLYKNDIFKTMITSNIKIEEAPSNFNSIFAYDSGCLGASLYRDWIKNEFLKRHKLLEKKKGERLEQLNAANQAQS
ncbi:MAG TPA: ParA family protein [Candidatus Krumholzibacteria bacterium]|nr:ParA family protein [Candidatus Krumholzibacteria bacterium]HRX50707.1 ParA family protein [Candidatus Krumholzibacteria bacterium]